MGLLGLILISPLLITFCYVVIFFKPSQLKPKPRRFRYIDINGKGKA